MDKFIMGAYMGKRKIGRPIKYNIRKQGLELGMIELIVNPRNRYEQYAANTFKFIRPYLCQMTYKFHAEKAREAGIRVEDIYNNKFHKEAYIMHHLYAQYFHPSTLLERVRDVRFYRQPRTIFKGFKVPDWAQAQQQHGWDLDVYSRDAWENALEDMHSEWTPQQFAGERQEPNVLQWFRIEQMGQGFGARLFYNEVPQLSGVRAWFRYGGHMLQNENDEREQHRRLHSFTHSNQDRDIIFGIDTTTEEGRAQYRAEWDALCELTPELIKKEDCWFPHEQPASISTEPHFRRAWQHYREHSFKTNFLALVEDGTISKEDASAFEKFVGLNSTPAFNIYIMARQGQLAHLQNDAGFQATMKVMGQLGLDAMEFDTKHTAEPLEEQFWNQFDGIYDLTEQEMKDELPLIITDPSNRAQVEAIMKEHLALE